MNPLEMTLEEIKQLVQTHQGHAAEYLKREARKEWLPRVHILCAGEPRTDLICIIASEFNEEENKRAVMRQIGSQLYASKQFPLAVVLISEAWMSSQTETQPRHDPQREEVIVVFGMDCLRKHTAVGIIPFTRGEGKRIIPGEPEPITTGCTPYILHHLFDAFTEEICKSRSKVDKCDPGMN